VYVTPFKFEQALSMYSRTAPSTNVPVGRLRRSFKTLGSGILRLHNKATGQSEYYEAAITITTGVQAAARLAKGSAAGPFCVA
jgi:hypothetical protein